MPAPSRVDENPLADAERAGGLERKPKLGNVIGYRGVPRTPQAATGLLRREATKEVCRGLAVMHGSALRCGCKRKASGSPLQAMFNEAQCCLAASARKLSELIALLRGKQPGVGGEGEAGHVAVSLSGMTASFRAIPAYRGIDPQEAQHDLGRTPSRCCSGHFCASAVWRCSK